MAGGIKILGSVLIRRRVYRNQYHAELHEHNMMVWRKAIRNSFLECCPLRDKKSEQDKLLMTGEIKIFEKYIRKHYNWAKLKKWRVHQHDYHTELRENSVMLWRKARISSWELFSEPQDDEGNQKPGRKCLWISQYSKTQKTDSTLAYHVPCQTMWIKENPWIMTESKILQKRTFLKLSQWTKRSKSWRTS